MRTLFRRAAWLTLAVLLAYLSVRMLAVVGNTPASPTLSVGPSSIKPTPIGGGTGRIAFATFGKNKINISNVDGTGLSHLADVAEPAQLHWSPDAKHLAARSVPGEIYVMQADGSNLIRLAETKGAGFLSWSPDSKAIAYDSHSGQSFMRDLQIYTVNIDGTELIQLTSGPGNHEHPAWSPDGRQIAFQFTKDPFVGDYEIHLVNTDGSEEFSIATGFANSQDILWSPDGRQLLVASGIPVQIYVRNADGSQLVQLTNTQEHNLQPSWSPDGRQILYTGFYKDSGSRIHVMNADGSDQRSFANDPEVGDGYAEWSPDGRWITYASTRVRPDTNCCTGCCVTVYIMKADGSGRRKLTDEIEEPIWRTAWQP